MKTTAESIPTLTASMISTAFTSPFLFFTGKGGVGKTSIASATAVTLAEQGRRVLLVSTDPASNLEETLGVSLSHHPSPVPAVPGLKALNIDPDQAAEEYRARVVAPLQGQATEAEIAGLREQLSGACTVEIAAFDEFTALIADPHLRDEFDLVIFDTAPTGHTLRLLSLPKAWTEFFDINERGASCLGPHTALKNQEERFAAALQALQDPARTTVVLVARPEKSTLNEAARSSHELKELGLTKQILIINGVFVATDHEDSLARTLEAKSKQFLRQIPDVFPGIPLYQVPLKPFNTVGISALKALLSDTPWSDSVTGKSSVSGIQLKPGFSVKGLAKELAAENRGLVLVMGKGGVGKTTVAAALAVAIAKQGVPVHLTTTDPSAHIVQTLEGSLPQLKVSRIDPKEETSAYIEKVLATKGKGMDEEGIALLREDLASPCTEEVAVFHAFSRIVFEARRSLVILDTAPTGHTLLLLDAAGSYHREMVKKLEGINAGQARTPLMMIQDASLSKILLVTLAETTPVSEAAALQEDLRRASIEPYGWVVNRSLAASHITDPVLKERAAREQAQIQRVMDGLSQRVAILPFMAEDPVGIERLHHLLALEVT
jgi:arsenite-transporting ATPase